MTFAMIGAQAHTLLTSTETWGSDGRPSRSYVEAGTLFGSLQPASAKDIERLPEGVRTKDMRVLLSRQEVPTPTQQDPSPLAPPRVLAANGVTYDVVDVSTYDMPGVVLRHWRVMLARVPEHVSEASP